MNAKSEFIEWVKVNDPFLYEVAVTRHKLESSKNLNGLAGFDASGLFNSLVSTVKEVGSSVLNYRSQKKILDAQVKRAESGLPPLNAQSYVPSVNTGGALSPEQIRAAQQVAITNARDAAKSGQDILKYGALAVGAFLLYKRL